MSNRLKVTPNDLSAFWMPFTANRQFKQAPRMFASAKDMHYTTTDGRKVLDGTAGLWCVNAGHCRPKITEAIQHQAAELDYAPAFQMGHPMVFEFANRLVDIAPKGLDHVFFTNSGSELVETALKIALAYQRARGEGSRVPADRTRARLSWRQFRRHLGGRHRRQPQDVRHAADRRRSHAAHAPAGQERLHAGASPSMARSWRRARADRDAARCLDHRGGDRRAGGGLDRRAGPAEGLSEEAARDLRQARHPADLRRGHHRLRPPRHAVCGRLFRRAARHHDDRQGRHQRRDPDGRGVREEGDPRRLHERTRASDRVLPRLHLFRQSDRLRGRHSGRSTPTGRRGC